ncbi:formylmethanofuran dehydrogenase subunit E family protein [bacterium]|nr:formylmethanofuran dehydrogenase subunit E family protein [bacterium]
MTLILNRISVLHSQLNQVADFHGHRCPGIAYGLRVALTAIQEIDIKPGDDVIVQTETSLCPVDAIQVITGCTFGNGKLVFNPTGKQTFSFWNLTSGRAIRITCNKIGTIQADIDPSKPAMSLLESKIDVVLQSEIKDFLEISIIPANPPENQRF